MKKKKSRKKFLLFLVVMLIIIFIAIFILLQVLKKNKVIEYDRSITVNVADELPESIEYKYGKNKESVTVKWANIDVEDGKIYHSGEYTGYFKIKDKKYPVNLIVKDTVAPKIEGVSNLEIYENDEIDLLKNITVSDNSHDATEIIVKGDYSLTEKGEYELTYEAKDKEGNVSHETFILTVKEKVIPPSKPSTSIGTTSKGYKIEVINGVTYIDGILIANKTYSLPSTYAPGGLLPELNIAFSELQQAAASAGLNIYIISGYRSYYKQQTLYNNYVARDGVAEADTYSARAGHSEHQTGLAADVNSLYTSFADTAEGKWLNENCYKYGFILRYPKGKDSITGYMYEPWHIRYVGKDIAKKLYNNGNWITLEEYLGITSSYN